MRWFFRGSVSVALATSMVPLATGSDYGGSLRTPASFCGVVGFRPSPGVVPSEVRPIGLYFSLLAQWEEMLMILHYF